MDDLEYLGEWFSWGPGDRDMARVLGTGLALYVVPAVVGFTLARWVVRRTLG